MDPDSQSHWIELNPESHQKQLRLDKRHRADSHWSEIESGAKPSDPDGPGCPRLSSDSKQTNNKLFSHNQLSQIFTEDGIGSPRECLRGAPTWLVPGWFPSALYADQ